MCTYPIEHAILLQNWFKHLNTLKATSMQSVHTEVLPIDPLYPDLASIERAAALLRAGKLVVFPTETVYGLGADAFQTTAVECIFAAKGRPFNDPLIVHIADEEALEQLTSTIPPQVWLLAQTFWPGPLTLILPRSPRIPRLVTAGLETVAIRMPRHPVALALIRALGSPIAAPSANRFMHISPTTAQHALTDLAGRVPLILDSGACEVGVESTVLDLCSALPTILRPGGISLEALRSVLPDVQSSSQRIATPEDISSETEALRSPGQLLTHYAPAVPLFLFDGPIEAVRTALLAEVRRRLQQGQRVGVLVADEDVATFRDSGGIVQAVGAANAPEQVAATLFAGLRALEEDKVEVILSRSFDEDGLGLAIRDRLLKAAGGRVVRL